MSAQDDHGVALVGEQRVHVVVGGTEAPTVDDVVELSVGDPAVLDLRGRHLTRRPGERLVLLTERLQDGVAVAAALLGALDALQLLLQDHVLELVLRVAAVLLLPVSGVRLEHALGALVAPSRSLGRHEVGRDLVVALPVGRVGLRDALDVVEVGDVFAAPTAVLVDVGHVDTAAALAVRRRVLGATAQHVQLVAEVERVVGVVPVLVVVVVAGLVLRGGVVVQAAGVEDFVVVPATVVLDRVVLGGVVVAVVAFGAVLVGFPVEVSPQRVVTGGVDTAVVTEGCGLEALVEAAVTPARLPVDGGDALAGELLGGDAGNERSREHADSSFHLSDRSIQSSLKEYS